MPTPFHKHLLLAFVCSWCITSTPLLAAQEESKARASQKADSNKKEQTKFWVSSTGKVHNSACRYYGKSKNGHYSTSPNGSNCKFCGGSGNQP